MGELSNTPAVVKCSILLIGNVEPPTLPRAIILQYNPDSLSRSFQIQATGEEGGGHSEAMRIKGPAVETIKLEAEIDAVDQLKYTDQNSNVRQFGIHPQLALLERLINPSVAQLERNNSKASMGELEILPMEAPLTLFQWGAQRLVPVRITEFSVTEEAFDPSLNPLRAKVSLGMRVLSVDDLGFSHSGGRAFMEYLRNRETLALKT